MIKKKFDKLLNFIKNSHLEIFSCFLLLLWTISPLVEYILKCFNTKFYTHYFSTIIYIIGSFGFLIYIIYFIKFKKKEKLNIKKFIPELLLFVLLIISIIATILSDNPHLSFFGEIYRKEGLLVYIMYIGIILLSSTIKNDKYIKYLSLSIIIICLLITINPLFSKNFNYLEFSNVFHNSNHYAYYLMINIILTIFMFLNSNKLIKKIIYILIYVFLLYFLIRNNTFGSYLAILGTLVFLFMYSMIKKYERRKIIFIVIAFIITSYIGSNYYIKIGEGIYREKTRGIVSNNISILKNDITGFIDKDEFVIENAGNRRGILWKEAWKYTLNHPVFGGGMECLKNYYISDRKEYYSFHNDRPHSVILQTSSFIGIPGAIIYLAFIIYIALSNLTIIKKNTFHIMIYCTAMCYFASSLVGNSMYYTSPYFMILLGILVGFNRCKKERK